jgi:hypothetical protein
MSPDTPTPSQDEGGDLPEQVNDDIGGVQGTGPDELSDDDATGAAAVTPGAPADAPAPDAGEIEWAGQLVKKPPTPGA